MATITCADCGEVRERCPSNTKYCKLCRLGKNLKFLGDPRYHKDCTNCNESFAPLRRDDQLCGDCNAIIHSSITPEPEGCSFCGTQKVGRVIPDVKVCHVCARNPALRIKIIQAINIKIQKRIEANDAVKS